MSLRPLLELVRNRDFMLVWWSGFISGTGNFMLFVALPVFVYDETSSTLATGVSVMASALPSVVVSQGAGVLVDRWDYRRTMLAANLTLVPVTLLYLAAASAPWWWVVPVAFVQSSVGQFLGPAENALLPTLVAERRLGAANSLNALNNNLARLIGPAAGGLLVAAFGFEGVVVVDMLTYLVAALLLLGVKSEGRGSRESAEENSKPLYRRLLAEWRDGLRAVGENNPLRLSFVAAALVGFGEGFVSTLMAPFIKVMLGGDGADLGYLFSAQALGGIAAGLALTGFADRVAPTHLLIWGSLLSGLVLVPIFVSPLFYPALWLILVLTALAGLPFAAWNTAQMTLLQTEAAPKQRGRVFASYFATFGFTQLLGMFVSGILGDRVGVMVIAVDAATYLLAGIAVFLIVKRLR